ncbi:hypothetical protein [Sphingomonas sp. Y38-1Y]|uniref:hypothetical protein n=1 Tax=Sphingomonas sp. Y38-1Y TaxID=3078265 RepID=UPI0028EF5ECE|nr:hypothetical protein [Sphingomonas sp. Y38-1Y]
MDLEESGLAASFEEAVENYQRNTKSETKIDFVSISILADYFHRSAEYGAAEKTILAIMGLESLSSPSTWQPHLQSFDPSFVFSNVGKIRQTMTFLPRVLSLLERDYEDIKSSGGGRSDGLELQTVILTDEGDALSTPERVIELLSSISTIYQVLAKIEGVSENSIAVVGLDSGSEKSFDFLGVAKLMLELRETLQWVYNTIWFHKHNVTIKNLQVTGETLGVIQKISKMEADGQLDAESSARMKHGIFVGLERFANTGAYIPEMKVQQESPALTMRPQHKLLTSNPAAMVRDAKDEPSEPDANPIPQTTDVEGRQEGEDSTLTRQDIEKLLKLVEKANADEERESRPQTAKPRSRRKKVTPRSEAE